MYHDLYSFLVVHMKVSEDNNLVGVCLGKCRVKPAESCFPTFGVCSPVQADHTINQMHRRILFHDSPGKVLAAGHCRHMIEDIMRPIKVLKSKACRSYVYWGEVNTCLVQNRYKTVNDFNFVRLQTAKERAVELMKLHADLTTNDYRV